MKGYRTILAMGLALAVALWGRGGRLRALGLIALAAVSVQGALGGLRRFQRIRRGGEGRAEGIAYRLEDMTAVCLDRQA